MNASNISKLVRANAMARLADSALDTLAETPVQTGKGFGETVKDALSNRYVIGSLAAVAVAGAAYGTYRGVKAYRAKKGDTTTAAPAAEQTAEQQILEARRLLTAAETALKNTAKSAVAA